ncbi:hypothetical protein NUW58_g734 [Xylaria curta]|uniref:Uncharacterized protein n=1 Tax=Xylaria curta TaxID=42375 RepID=A0ACC1PN38_9PEZI|nr:hypothetical protein NUW58_g734 [Xylaria curta]
MPCPVITWVCLGIVACNYALGPGSSAVAPPVRAGPYVDPLDWRFALSFDGSGAGGAPDSGRTNALGREAIPTDPYLDGRVDQFDRPTKPASPYCLAWMPNLARESKLGGQGWRCLLEVTVDGDRDWTRRVRSIGSWRTKRIVDAKHPRFDS